MLEMVPPIRKTAHSILCASWIISLLAFPSYGAVLRIHELSYSDRLVSYAFPPTLRFHELEICEQGFDSKFQSNIPAPIKEIEALSAELSPDRTYSLQELIDIALQTNQILEIAKQVEEQSRNQLGQARAGYLPQLSISGRYFYTERKDSSSSDSQATNSTEGNESDDLEKDNILHGSATLSQMVYDFGRTSGEIRQGKYNLEASSAQRLRQAHQIIFEVRHAYYQVLEKQRLIDIAKESVKSFEQHFHHTSLYYKAGIRTKIDVINAEVELSNAKLELLRAQYGLQTARTALEYTLGIKPADGHYQIARDHVNVNTLLRSIPPAPDDLDALQELATDNRPDLLSLLSLKKAAEANVRTTTGDYWPSISAEASYNDYDTDLSLYKDSWEAGVTLRWDLFSGMRTNNMAKEAKSRLIEARSRLNNQKLQVIKEVTDSFLKAREYFESVTIAAKTLELAKQNVALAEKRYQSGTFSVLEFNDAQLKLTQISNELVITYYNYLTALAGVDYATGINPKKTEKSEPTEPTAPPVKAAISENNAANAATVPPTRVMEPNVLRPSAIKKVFAVEQMQDQTIAADSNSNNTTAALKSPLPDQIKRELPPLAQTKLILPFRPDSTLLTDAAAIDLKNFIAKLKAYPKAVLLLKGYVAAKTNSVENIRLSANRAEMVKQLFVQQGIAPARIQTRGMGNRDPIASNDTYAGRRQNRRVELLVTDDGM